jgi:hypothetical protein
MSGYCDECGSTFCVCDDFHLGAPTSNAYLADKLTLALRILGIGEPLRGCGHLSSLEIAERLLENFDITPKSEVGS